MRKTKNALILLLVVCLLLAGLPFPAALAAEGSCGDNATWTLNETTGTLVISGTGAIAANAFRYYGTNPEVLKIKNVYVSEGITEIGGGAFLNCSNLKTISLPDSVTSVGPSAFSSCSSLTDVYYGGTTAQWNAINIADMNNSYFTGATRHDNSLQEPPVEPTPTPAPDPTEYLIYEIVDGHVVITDCTQSVPAHVIIPDTIEGLPVTEIAAHAFQSDDRITKITIPASVTTMVFEPLACSIYYLLNLTAVEVAADNPNYCSINGVLYTKDMRTLLHFPAEWGAYYQIPDGVTKIAPRAFLYSRHLMGISIPDSVTEIGNLAFSDCYWLTAITLPDGLSTISASAFLTCTNLARIDIPKSVTLIEESAFRDCIRLADIYYGGTEEDWQKVTIKGIDDPLDNGRMKNATIHYSDPEPEPDPPEPPTPSGDAPTIVLGSSALAGGQASSVYFGNYYQSSRFGTTTEPVKWRVLFNGGGKLFLVSDQNLYEHEYATDCTNFTWATCSLRTWLNGTFLTSAFSAKEQAAIANTALENADNLYGEPPTGAAGTTDRVFCLSIAEVTNTDYFPTKSSRIATDTAYAAHQNSAASEGGARAWWLRSRGAYVDWGALVLDDGTVDGIWANNIRGVRPAFHLDLNTVLYASAAVYEAHPVGSMSKPGTNTANEWQLTLKDSSRNSFTATGGGTVEVGTSATVTYSNAKTGTSEYVSAIIADSGNNILAYGHLAQNSASGTASVPILDDLAPGSYTLKVFSEQDNGVRNTGLASNFVDLSLTVVEEGALVDPHTHVFSTSWVKDGSGHWHQCECGEKADVAAHTPVTDPAVEATCTAPGKTEGSHCSVCGNVITPQTETPAKGHSDSDTWNQDDTNHWHECSVCHEKTAQAPHAWNGGEVTTPPTSTDAGVRTYTCTVCARTRTETVPATGGGSTSGGGGSGSGSGSGGGSVSQKPPTPLPVEVVPEPVKLPFTDVRESDWYYDAVAFVYERGLLLGTAADKFAPHQSLTRSMAVTILYRLAGEPETNVSIPFTDVEDGSYYEKAVRWAYGQGIVAGRTQTDFAPDALLTRQELATLLYRYSGALAPEDTLTAFLDGEQSSDFARPALCWAVDRGIVSGRGNGILDPLGSSKRAEAAAMFMRYQKHVPSNP